MRWTTNTSGSSDSHPNSTRRSRLRTSEETIRYPRETDLQKLVEELDISHQALSERPRRATMRLVGEALGLPHRRPHPSHELHPNLSTHSDRRHNSAVTESDTADETPTREPSASSRNQPVREGSDTEGNLSHDGPRNAI